MGNPIRQIANWFGARTRSQRFEQSSQRLQEDLLRMHPDAGQWINLPAFIAQLERAGLVYDGALKSGVAGLYPVDHAWPQHPTIKLDLINWPREGQVSFWPPISRARPAHCLPSHAPRTDHATLAFTPANLPQVLEQAAVLSREAFEHNRAHASLENVVAGGALDRT